MRFRTLLGSAVVIVLAAACSGSGSGGATSTSSSASTGGSSGSSSGNIGNCATTCSTGSECCPTPWPTPDEADAGTRPGICRTGQCVGAPGFNGPTCGQAGEPCLTTGIDCCNGVHCNAGVCE
jgi:hypothetical protein